MRRWLESPIGIAGWWSDKVEGAAASVGDRFRVSFPSTPVVFELVVAVQSPEKIEWHVPECPPWWKGTHIDFELSGDGPETTLLFTHRGFDPDDPIIQVITPAWVRFLDSLVARGRVGRANPAVVN